MPGNLKCSFYSVLKKGIQIKFVAGFHASMLMVIIVWHVKLKHFPWLNAGILVADIHPEKSAVGCAQS